MVVLATAALAPAQRVISAKSGLVYFVQGRAWVDNGQLRSGEITRQLRDGETLYTERGRAEVLLNPGAVLRLGEVSRLRMDDVRITDSCVSLLSGSAVVTVKILPKGDRVELHIGGGVVFLRHPGVYRFDSGKYDVNQARIRVYSGRAEVHRGTAAAKLLVGAGRSVMLDDLQLASFDTKETDALQVWAETRSRTPAPRGLRPIPPRMDSRVGVPRPQTQGALEASQRSLSADSSGGPILSDPTMPGPDPGAQLPAARGQAAGAELAQAAKSPHELALFVNSHEKFDWAPLWRAAGIRQSMKEWQETGVGHSAQVIEVPDPPQAIVILHQGSLAPVLLRYRSNGRRGNAATWTFGGAHMADGRDFDPKYTLTQMAGKPYFTIQQEEFSGRGSTIKHEKWIDLTTARFEPVVHLVTYESIDTSPTLPSRETTASIVSWESEPVETVVVEYRASEKREGEISKSASAKATFVRQGDTFIFDPTRSTASEKDRRGEFDVDGPTLLSH